MAFEELKDRIKESPVSMVLSHYMSLNKKGANLEGICPFHPDTKPSLKVNDTKGMYKCFVCGAGGDSITFVKEFKRIEFVEALKEIAGLLGLPFEDLQKEKKKNPRVEMAFRVLNASSKLYRKIAASGPAAFTDFLEKRKLSPESVENFQLGYVTGNNVFYQYLQSIPGPDGDLAFTVAKEIGVIKFNENRNSHYDFYRDRVMFPIQDHTGQIRGYSSRTVYPDQIPKYLNSGESFIFDKGSILYGFYLGKNAIRQTDQAIIVEGNMDVVMMHQFGFLQTVATMGTALSDHSVKLLSNMTKNIFLALDSDPAGKKAMLRINADFLSLGTLPKFLNFAPHKDPDEFLLNEGRLALIERIEKAPIYLDVLISELIPEKIPENLEHKLNTLHRVFDLVSPLKEHLSASERIVNIAKTLGLKSDSKTILDDYKAHLSRQKEKGQSYIDRPKIKAEEESLEEQEVKARNLHAISPSQVLLPPSKSEKLFIREILCHPEFLTHLKADEFLAYIGHDEVKRLVHWLVKIYLEIDDLEYVSIVQEELQYGGYSKAVIDIGTDALFNYGNKYNEKVIVRMLKDYQLMLKMDQLKTKRKELVERQKSTPSQNEVDLVLSEISKIDKEILNLKNTVS
ncbi:MAG TPA: DNA primase [Bacteriovoracaceae bacterium]|nr:DNA primase [Bacteriovoracaceae bacterium]